MQQYNNIFWPGDNILHITILSDMGSTDTSPNLEWTE